MTRRHLTYTGYWAGQLLCDASKEKEIERGATFSHAMYANLENPDVCPDCLAVWNSPDDEEPVS